MRLIDADKIKLPVNLPYKASVKRVLAMAPTAEAVEVVRCKNCRRYEMGVCLKIYSDGAVSMYAWQTRKPDDFCSYGERRDANGERKEAD